MFAGFWRPRISGLLDACLDVAPRLLGSSFSHSRGAVLDSPMESEGDGLPALPLQDLLYPGADADGELSQQVVPKESSATGDSDLSLTSSAFKFLQNIACPRQPKRQLWTQRSSGLLAFARARKQMRRVQRDLNATQDLVQQQEIALQNVQVSTSSLAKRVRGGGGLPKAKRQRASSAMTLQRAAALSTACFGRPTVAVLGVMPEALLHAAPEIVLDQQSTGFHQFLNACAHLRSAGHKVIFSCTHEWDETQHKIMMADTTGRSAVTQVRCGKFALSTHVMAQRVCVRIRIISPDAERSVSVVQDAVSPPLALGGLTARHLVVALNKGALCSLEKRQLLELLNRAADVCIWQACADRASSNKCVVRHLRSLAGRQQHGACLHIWHEEYCSLHAINRIKISNQDLKSSVGSLYCLANLMKQSSTLNAMTRAFEDLAQKAEWRRGVRPPSTANRDLIELLFDLSSGCHVRQLKDGSLRPSMLASDLKFMLEMDNGPWGTPVVTHFCWSDDLARPCCSSEDEFRSKLLASWCNVYCAHGWRLPAQSRFTNVRCTSNVVLMGLVQHDLLRRVLPVFADLEAGERDLDPAALGAGDSDFMGIQMARKTRVANFLTKQRLAGELAVQTITSSPLDNLQYDFLGCQKGEGKPRMSLHDLVCPRSSAPGMCQQIYHDLLRSWQEASAPGAPWFLVSLLCCDTGRQEVKICARRHVLVPSAGLFRRMELPLSQHPYQLHKLICPDCTDDAEKNKIAQDLLDASECCCGTFAKSLRKTFPTREAMRGPDAQNIVETWQASLKFTTDHSERAHAANGRLLKWAPHLL